MTKRLGPVAIFLLVLMSPTPLKADDAEDAALKLVKDIGGHVVRWRKGTTYQVVEVNLTGCIVTPGTLRQLNAFPHLEGLSIGGEDFLFDTRFVTAKEIKEIQELKNLRTLILIGGEITDTEVKELRELKQLQTLELRRTTVTDEGAKELQKALPKCEIKR